MNEFTKRKSTFALATIARTEIVGHAMRKLHRKCWRSWPLGHMYRRDDVEKGATFWSRTCVACGKFKLKGIK